MLPSQINLTNVIFSCNLQRNDMSLSHSLSDGGGAISIVTLQTSESIDIQLDNCKFSDNIAASNNGHIISRYAILQNENGEPSKLRLIASNCLLLDRIRRGNFFRMIAGKLQCDTQLAQLCSDPDRNIYVYQPLTTSYKFMDYVHETSGKCTSLSGIHPRCNRSNPGEYRWDL